MSTEDLIRDLHHHRELCQEALDLFASPGAATRREWAARKTLPARLDLSLNSLRRWRQWWRNLSTAQRHAHPEVARLLQDTLDLMMKSIVQGREAFERQAAGPRPADPAAGAAASPARPEPDRPRFARVEAPARTAHFVARRYARYAD